jgi:hypothetical protein
MTVASLPPLLTDRTRRYLGWTLTFVVLALGAFKFPLHPSADLDPSWRVALGHFFLKGTPFGSEVVLTYGPLGYIMGNTYSGEQWWPILIGQAALGFVSAVVIVSLLRRLEWRTRLVSLVYFLLLGVAYEDALHMLVIVIAGFELLRHARGGAGWWVAFLVAVLGLYSQIKFTDFILSAFAVAVAAAYAASQRDWRYASAIASGYLASYLAVWVACGQSIPDLLPYLHSSWQISQGYQDAMGIPTPPVPLAIALGVILLFVAYALAHLWLHPDLRRAAANVLLLAAFVFLNWKHGFVRSDGHMIGFFFCALLPFTSYPALLEDTGRLPRAHKAMFALGVFLCVWGTEAALHGVIRNALGNFQTRVIGNIDLATRWENTRGSYANSLQLKQSEYDLHRIRKIVGDAPVDVLGFEQGYAIFNRLNYRPRPLIQSYFTFTPHLAQRNRDFFLSERAPEYVLLKIQTIDERMPMMDDPLVLSLLVHRYDYVTTEKGFQLWRRNPGPFDAAVLQPAPQRTSEIGLGESHSIADLGGQPVWLTVDVELSLLGKLRRFLYKPAPVRLAVTDTNGASRTFRLPLPIGRTGFVVSPMIEDPIGYILFASNRPQRVARDLRIEVDPADRAFFKGTARLEIATLAPSNSGQAFFDSINQRLFHMFRYYPVAYEANTGLSEQVVEGKDLAILHAPSEMTFDFPKGGARLLTGEFGFLPNAYQNGGNTNGAEYVIYWTDGPDRVDLFRRFLDPVKVAQDRGLQQFALDVSALKGGRLHLRIETGPYNDNGWDWTGWTGIELK